MKLGPEVKGWKRDEEVVREVKMLETDAVVEDAVEGAKVIVAELYHAGLPCQLQGVVGKPATQATTAKMNVRSASLALSAGGGGDSFKGARSKKWPSFHRIYQILRRGKLTR